MSDVTEKSSNCRNEIMWHCKRNISPENNPINPKRRRYQYYYVLESESSSASEDGPESIHSIQDRETDYAKDTTDTDTKSELSDFDMQVEYEVMSSSEEERMLEECSSSGPDDVILAAGALVATIREDTEIDEIWVTEGEDSETDSDSYAEFHLEKLNQKCRMCLTRDTFSVFPLCSHCYQIRKTSFPPRPRSRKNSKKLFGSAAVTQDSLRSCLSSLSQDSGVGTSQELPIVHVDWDKIKVPANIISKSVESSDFSATSSQNITYSDTWSTWALAIKELCMMCNEKPKNGIFIHGTTAHMCCCYNCAVKFWANSKRCAYCNRKVSNVVKAFIV